MRPPYATARPSASSGVRRTYGAIRRRAQEHVDHRRRPGCGGVEGCPHVQACRVRISPSCCDERRPRQHLADAGLARRVDHVGLHVRRIADRRDRRERRILLSSPRRSPSGPIRSLLRSKITSVVGFLRIVSSAAGDRAGETQIDAELVRRSLDFRAEHQIVENG